MGGEGRGAGKSREGENNHQIIMYEKIYFQ